jgi:imidazolonepropionase-like amidohydrolase
VRAVDGTITAVGMLTPLAGEKVIDASGQWVAPAFIDSHVHLLYLPAASEMAANGVAGVVDLAAPTEIFATSLAPLRAVVAGPMITAIAGYPTQSWGAGGYGRECADAAAAVAAVKELHALGAGVIKLPITEAPQLDDAALMAAVAAAHELGLPVVSHALSDEQARRAAAVGVDVLAHTPTEMLSAKTVQAWSGRTVISTLRAFGGSAVTLANLQALKAAGATVLYGTDFGNTSTPGVDLGELMLLQAVGLTPEEIVAAGTSAPAGRWVGLGELGAVAVGKDASVMLLASDPLVDPRVLASPTAVVIRGVQQAP